MFFLFSLSISGQKGIDIVIPMVNTVLGPIPADSMGLTLIHEHVFLDWSKASDQDETLWDTPDAIRVISPFLTQMKKQGVHTFLECTPAFLGRNPELLVRLSQETGLHILTNTGYYAARNYDHLPEYFYELSVNDIAQIWIREFESGIGDSGVKPGFIKIGMDSKDDLTSTDVKLVSCAAKTHLETGLTIVSHTGDDTTAVQQLEILKEMGVSPSAFVWTHAQRGTSRGHVNMAAEGCWISLDGLGWINPEDKSDSGALSQYLDFLLELKSANLLHRTLISHDAGWYTVGHNEQSGYKPYTPIFEVIIPLMIETGFNEEDIDQLLIKNPRTAYQIKVRAYP